MLFTYAGMVTMHMQAANVKRILSLFLAIKLNVYSYDK